MLDSRCGKTHSALILCGSLLGLFAPATQAADIRPEPLGTVKGTIQAILPLHKDPNQIFFATQNPGADCGRGTPATIWNMTLDPATGELVSLKKQQDLSKIQNTRNSLFKASDGTLFTGGGWCLYKPPYFSTDRGKTWRPADAGPVHPPNSTFSFAEFADHVYAGTGYEPYHGQVYRWLGEGNWKRVLDIPPPRSIVLRMVAHDDRLFVGSQIYGWGGRGRGREKSVPVYASTDGEHFEPTTGIPGSCSVGQLFVLDGRLVAWVYEYGNAKKRFVYAWNGTSWKHIGDLAQGIHPSYAAVYNKFIVFGWSAAIDGRRAGLCVSTDVGLSWKLLAPFERITALRVQRHMLYLAARGDEKDTSQIYRIALKDLGDRLAKGQDCGCPESDDPLAPKRLPTGIIARASSVWHDKDAAGAFDGNSRTCWRAGDTAPQWIEADLGSKCELKTITLTPQQAKPEKTVHEVWVSDKPMNGSREGRHLGKA